MYEEFWGSTILVPFLKTFIYFIFLSVIIMSETDAHIQEPHDEEGLEEEDPNPSDILQPSLVHDLIQKGVLPQRSVQEGNSMSMRWKFTVKFRGGSYIEVFLKWVL